MGFQGFEELGDIGLYVGKRDPKLRAEPLGDQRRRVSLVEHIEDSRAKRVQAKHCSAAEIQHDASICVGHSADAVGKGIHRKPISDWSFCAAIAACHSELWKATDGFDCSQTCCTAASRRGMHGESVWES
jgi:hypothetical protein